MGKSLVYIFALIGPSLMIGPISKGNWAFSIGPSSTLTISAPTDGVHQILRETINPIPALVQKILLDGFVFAFLSNGSSTFHH